MHSKRRAFLMLFVLLASSIFIPPQISASEEETMAWDPFEQPWAQYGRDPGHSRDLPLHGNSGLTTITTPAQNWQAFDSGLGADGYGVAIANFSASINSPPGAVERCGQGHLFAVMTRTDQNSGERYLSIIEGDSAKTVWEVNLGSAKYIRSTPMIVDVNGDNRFEIVIVYDTDVALKVDLWAPELNCDESGWSSSGHSNERLWSWSDADLRIGIASPHWFTSQSNHLSVTQPLLADLSLDGSPDVVIAAVDTSTDEPTVIAIPLGLQTPETDWEVSLDRGTHPSDPAFAALDAQSGAVVLTTVDSNSGNMWIWRIDGATGSLDWERVSIQGTDSDSDTPRLRLPGPIITQLDSDAAPEMILTLPVDSNGDTEGMGAQFVGMELTSTGELWRFRAKNGYADAEPIAVDTSGDGITDRVCWVTWYSDSSWSTDREGAAGCHDITIEPPFREWSRTLQKGSGTDNDEIAVAPPLWIDIDGEGEPELLVAFGQRIFAFDGNTGTPADVGSGWAAPIELDHRAWAAPAIADLDGDGHLDILVGDILISEALVDLAPLADGRGIEFTPTDPDPGEMVTITGQFANIGIISTDEPVDAAIFLDGVEIKRSRVNIVEPVAPSGEGGPITFSIDVEATLGVHSVELILDPNSNITQSRYDNDNFSTTLVVLEPYVSTIQIPAEMSRTLPGTTSIIEIICTSKGSRDEAWTLSYDNSNLPAGWSFNPLDNLNFELQRDLDQTIRFEFTVPADALGTDDAQVPLTLSLDQDPSTNSSVILPLEVLRTTGLSLQGPSGLDSGIGYGKPGDLGHIWFRVENVGNGQETTEMQWSSNSWSTGTRLVDQNGQIQWGIELEPSSSKEFWIEFDIPAGRSVGESTSATLTLCIGSQEEEICEDFVATVFASEVSSTGPHIRTVPAQNLTWDLSANMPNSGQLVWDMSTASMLKEGWVWTASGDLTIVGTDLIMTGPDGVLRLDLPFDTPPNRHFFNQSDAVEPNSDLAISLHVLQVYRAQASVVEPDDGSTFNVSERTKIILKLENPGNGEDTFTLEGFSVQGDLEVHPIVQFEISNPVRILGPGGISMVPVWVTLDQDIPARESFNLQFDWTSQGDSSIADSAIISIEARPDHRWNLSVGGGQAHDVIPGQEFSVIISANNQGNTNDILTMSPTLSIVYQGTDDSNWTASNLSSPLLEIGQTESLVWNISIPEETWAGTIVNVEFTLSSDNFIIDQILNLNLTVSEIAGWRFDLSNTNLEVPPQGGEITLIIEQLGNAPSQPWFVKAAEGWEVSLPTNAPMIDPGSSAFISVNITPPSDAIAGEVGVVSIRISNGDGSGQVLEQVPVRVGSAPAIYLEAKGAWMVRADLLSHPTAWIENGGNDVALMQLSIANAPPNWTIKGEGAIVIAPGEIIGVPLEIQPAANWDQSNFQLQIILQHPTLGEINLPITISNSDTVFTTTPVLSGRAGQQVSITTNTVNEGDSTSTITLPQGRENTTHNGMSLHLIGIEAPIHQADCETNYGDLSSLGIEPLTRDWASCTLIANSQSGLTANLWLRSDDGSMIDSQTIRLSPGGNITLNLTATNWDPNGGNISVEILIIDSNGLELYRQSSDHVAHDSDWNIGISSFTIDAESINIGISREGYSKLDNAICSIVISHIEGTWSKTIALKIAEGKYAPVIKIDRPSDLVEGDTGEARISCASPWDIDDDDSDDYKTAIATKIPVLTYDSSDITWTVSIAAIMVGVAWFVGLLRFKTTDIPTSKNKNDLPKTQTKPVDEIIDKFESELDDMSFEEDEELIETIEEITPDSSPITDSLIESSPEIIDIDEGSASGKLSALRTEMETDDNNPTKVVEDISSRLDAFLNER